MNWISSERLSSLVGGGSRQFESIEGPGRCSGRCSGGQTEMGEDLGNHGGMFDGGDRIFKVPPHWGHCSMPISNTRLRKPSPASPCGPAFAVRNRSRRFCEQPGPARGQAPREGAPQRGPLRVENRRERSRSRSAEAQEPECMLKYMRIPSTAGTRDPERVGFFPSRGKGRVARAAVAERRPRPDPRFRCRSAPMTRSG